MVSSATEVDCIRGDEGYSPPCFPCDADGGSDERAIATATSQSPAGAASSPYVQIDMPRSRSNSAAMSDDGSVAMDALAAVALQQQQQLQMEQENANVGQLVSKAKKAAITLWTILHAQVRLCSLFILYSFSPIIFPAISSNKRISKIFVLFQELPSTRLPPPRLRRNEAPANPREVLPRLRSQLAVPDAMSRVQRNAEAAGALPTLQGHEA